MATIGLNSLWKDIPIDIGMTGHTYIHTCKQACMQECRRACVGASVCACVRVGRYHFTLCNLLKLTSCSNIIGCNRT